MLHELLMALNGYPGSIFFDSSDGIKVSSSIPHLHPAEKTILERLCLLGTKYKYLSEFVKKHKIHTAIQKSEIYGLYLESFCCGLDAVLCIYRQELISMEKELLQDPFLPLTHFLKLEKYSLLFQVLSGIVSEVVSEKVLGCRILDLLYNQSNSGDSLVEMSMNKILQHCHSVMFRQVFCWMMNGFVEDPYKEFFVQPDISIQKKSRDLFVKTFEEDSHMVKYMVKPELLPSYIPSDVAAKILFVGEYVSVLDSTDNSDTYSLFLKKEHVFAKKIEKLLEKPVFSLLSFETLIDDIRKCAAQHLWQVIVKGANVVHHLKIMKDFYLLGRGELFLSFIEEANQLLRMPVTTTAESDASKLFQAVARKIFPDDDSITEKFHITLQAKVKKPKEVDRESLSKMKLESGWSSIGLIYDVPHPLHILITPNVIDRYNMVFRFLLSVRKVQIELHQCWALQMRNKGAGQDSSFMPLWKLRSHMSFLVDNFQYYVLVDVLESCFNNLLGKMETVKDFEEIQQYHNRFLSSVTSQCFLELLAEEKEQWEVISTCLKKWYKSKKCFYRRAADDKHMFIVIRKLLLKLEILVFHSLNEILEICSSFCTLMNRIHSNLNQRDISQFENLKLNFQRQTSLLFRILSGVRSHQVSPHLAQLILRIDYNKYLSSCGGQLGGTPATPLKL